MNHRSKNQWNAFEAFKKYQVEADGVGDFIARYYRPERLTDTLVGSYQQEAEGRGFCWISHHDNITGRIVSYYPLEAQTIRAGSNRIPLAEAEALCENDMKNRIAFCKRCGEDTVHARTVGCSVCMGVEILTRHERIDNMAEMLAEIASGSRSRQTDIDFDSSRLRDPAEAGFGNGVGIRP